MHPSSSAHPGETCLCCVLNVACGMLAHSPSQLLMHKVRVSSKQALCCTGSDGLCIIKQASTAAWHAHWQEISQELSGHMLVMLS